MIDDQQPGEPPQQVLTPKATVSLSFTVRATASVLHRLAGNHLWAAAHFSRTVRATETANAGRKFGDGTFFAEIQAGFHACVMLCGAALDANVNELMETELREGRVAFADPKAFKRWIHTSNPLKRYSELAVLVPCGGQSHSPLFP